MPTQTNYNHIKNELLHAKLKIIELEKQIQEYKQLKKNVSNVSFSIDDLPRLACQSDK